MLNKNKRGRKSSHKLSPKQFWHLNPNHLPCWQRTGPC